MEKEQSVAPEQDRLPRLADGFDLRALPIGPAEAFVLSGVDGSTTEAELAAAAGMPLSEVNRILTRLAELGAVLFELRASGTPHATGGGRTGSGEFRMGKALNPMSIVEEPPRAPQRHPGAALYDEAELEDEADLDLERKRKILDLYYRLETLNHYELLGVEPSADKRVIKARYYEVVNLFHPDRYYGKKLGKFKVKLERIFQELTEAQEVLTRTEARAEYDDYLRAEQSTAALERKLHDQEAHARELREVQERIEAEAKAKAEAAAISSLAASDEMAETTSVRPAPGALRSSLPPSEPRREVPKPDADARKRALARKLGVSMPPPGTSIRPAPAISNASTQQRAVEELRGRYQAHMQDAKRRQAADYEARAREALEKGQLVDAVNALRIAVSLVPDQLTLKQSLLELEARLARELADRYVEQARYEEREKRWADAARSYTRALAGKPAPELSERVATCLMNAELDIRRALAHARTAVLATPSDPKFRVTLARAYLAAKMRESALGELQRASALAPSDDTIKEQIRRIGRGES